MMLPLCTRVTERRPLARAYRIAARTSRFDPVSDTGLIPSPLSGRRSHPYVLVEELEQLAGALGTRLELLAGVDVLGVLPEDHHVDQLGMLHR